MLAVFCLRLAAGMLACLLVLPSQGINPRIYRTHFLTVLGLVCLAWVVLPVVPPRAGLPLNLLLLASLILAVSGSIIWWLHGNPGGILVLVLTTLTLFGGLLILDGAADPLGEHLLRFLKNIRELGIEIQASKSAPLSMSLERAISVLLASLTSALVLGSVMTAMLIGHSYLISPNLSLTPLYRMLILLAIGLVARMAVDGYAFWCWTVHPDRGILSNDIRLFLPVRWFVGFVLPFLLVGMAWHTTRMRSTQSSTGILYVAVIFCFLGELLSLLLRENGVTL